MGNVDADILEYTLNENKKGFVKPTLVKPKIICSKEDWKRMDKEEALKKECEKTFNDFFIRVRGVIKPRPKEERPKISKLTKRIYSEVVLQIQPKI